jgi:hypothetical protein
MSKIGQKFSDVHLTILCWRTKFREELFFVAGVKKYKRYHVNSNSEAPKN